MKYVLLVSRFLASCLSCVIFAAVSAFCALLPAHAEDFQAWNAVALTSPAAKDSKLMLWFDGHARFADDAGRLGVSIIRPGLGYRVSDRATLWLGYARVTLHPGPDIDEDRIWQQATFPLGNFLGGSLSGRTRLEQRFRDEDNDTGVRLRQFFRWSRQLGESQYSAVVWDELFLGLNQADWGQRDGFDQNRAFLGLAWQPSPKIRAEAGYLHNRIGRGGPDQTNHALALTLFVRGL